MRLTSTEIIKIKVITQFPTLRNILVFPVIFSSCQQDLTKLLFLWIWQSVLVLLLLHMNSFHVDIVWHQNLSPLSVMKMFFFTKFSIHDTVEFTVKHASAGRVVLILNNTFVGKHRMTATRIPLKWEISTIKISTSRICPMKINICFWRSPTTLTRHK